MHLLALPKSDEAVLVDDWLWKETLCHWYSDPIEAIKIRMEELNLKQVDLVAEIGGKSRVSEVLNKKRKLTVDMIRNLTKRLNLSPELFNPWLSINPGNYFHFWNWLVANKATNRVWNGEIIDFQGLLRKWLWAISSIEKILTHRVTGNGCPVFVLKIISARRTNFSALKAQYPHGDWRFLALKSSIHTRRLRFLAQKVQYPHGEWGF